MVLLFLLQKLVTLPADALVTAAWKALRLKILQVHIFILLKTGTLMSVLPITEY
jgi:hypothetical protein